MQTGTAILLTALVLVAVVAAFGYFFNDDRHLADDYEAARAARDHAITERDAAIKNYKQTWSELEQYKRLLADATARLAQAEQLLAKEKALNTNLVQEIERLKQEQTSLKETLGAEQAAKAQAQADRERASQELKQTSVERDIAAQEWEKCRLANAELARELSTVDAFTAMMAAAWEWIDRYDLGLPGLLSISSILFITVSGIPVLLYRAIAVPPADSQARGSRRYTGVQVRKNSKGMRRGTCQR